MANTVTRTILENGNRNAVVLFTIVGDGSGEANAAIVLDYSDITPEPGAYYVKSVQAGTAGCSGRLSFDATTDVPFLTLGADVWTKFNAERTAGVRNIAGAGETGDIVLDTVGLGAGDSVSVYIWIVKGSV